MLDLISNAFFSIVSIYGLIAVAALGLYVVADKIRDTPFSWAFAIVFGCGAAYAAEFSAEIASTMALKIIPFQPWSVLTWAVIAFACIYVSAHARPSRWLISIPCVLIAALALQHGMRAGESQSTYAAIVTAIVGVVCWFTVPKEFERLTAHADP